MPSRRDFLVSVAQAGVALSALRLPKHSALFASGAPAPDSRLLDVPIGLDWRMLGPFRGGRCDAASGVPGRPDEFYFGHVNGGVWKTTDAGRTWLPVFDDQPVASIGALAVAPSAPDVIYAGTGESTLRDSVGFGNGVYKSTDAGRTWTVTSMPRTPSAACSARATAAAPGRKSSTRTRTSARSRSSSTRAIRAWSTRDYGIRGGRRGSPTPPPTDPVAGSTSPLMADRPGSS